jgi:uncharacterized protein (DUF1015 family)
MADLRGFRGFRYDLGKVGSLADVIAPPYDVIDPTLEAQLLAKSPFNAVRVELAKAPADGTEAANAERYFNAGQTVRDWLALEVLRQDSARGIYVVEQEFSDESGTHVRRGFLARCRLEPFGTGKVFPHEQTLAGPKQDRLNLYRAAQFNLSPVFGLYPDGAGDAFAVLEPFIRTAPPVTAVDHLGTKNRLWFVTEAAAVSKLIGLLGPRPVYIADGHHRYEIGLKYRDELQAAGEVPDGEHPANFCLMLLVGMSDPGLQIQPTHRLVAGLGAVTGAELKAKLAPYFSIITEYKHNPAETWEDVQSDGTQNVLGFHTPADGTWLVARLTDPDAVLKLEPDRSDDWCGLAVSILHRLVLDQLFAGAGTCRYVHRLDEVTSATGYDLAVLVPPVGMDHVTAVAGHGETMPPKSTYFFPKVPTGLVFHSLKKD